LSATDWWRFYTDDDVQQTVNLNNLRDATVRDLALSVSDTRPGPLVLTDNCIDPKVLKVNAGVPVAFYHLGMAWPAHREAIDGVLNARARGDLALRAARVANIEWVITDSACSDQWESRYAAAMTKIRSVPYPLGDGNSAEMTVWRLGPPGA
jgi:hypothetical protein